MTTLQKLKVLQKAKTQNVTKHKNSECDKLQKLRMWQNPQFDETQNVTKLKKIKMRQLKNPNCGKTQKLQMWQNSITENVTKLNNSNWDKTKKNQYVAKLKNLNLGKTQKLKMWQNSAKLKNLKCDKIEKLKIWQLKNPTYNKN